MENFFSAFSLQNNFVLAGAFQLYLQHIIRLLHFLRMIKNLIELYPDKIIGYSDHTLPGDMRILELAWMMGAEILEKHFTHDKTLPGNDHYHAMDKQDLAKFIKNVERVEILLGKE